MSARSILIVDDDRGIRDTMVRQLAAAGYDTTGAESAEAAMGMMGRRVVDPALVLTDLRMPGMSGLELLGWFRETAPDSDVIMMTAYEDMETAIAAIKGGAYDFLVKPLDLEHLELTVARCLRERALRLRMRELATEAAEPFALRRLIGRDANMIAISRTIGALARTRTPVLIRGETGTGKEVIARTIHYNSQSSAEPFVAINCTAVPETLLESELFGHMRGAFTGAVGDRKGRFELAGTGTLFLDEIGDVSAAFQAKLLRVLQDGEFYPVGAERPRRTAARIMAATHRPLEQLVRDGSFREDLYFRLRVVEIDVPPLRARRGDIRELANAILSRIQQELHKPLVLTDATVKLLERYDWPGNVRELENALMRAAVLARSGVIDAADLSIGSLARSKNGAGDTAADDLTLLGAVRRHALSVLAGTGGNKRRAAQLLNISRQRLDRILSNQDGAFRTSDSDETAPDGADAARDDES